MSKKGLIVVLSGFSGAGKGTIMKNLLKIHGDKYALSISATTRPIRQGEEDGREYFFKTREEFDRMVENDEFLEHATFNGNSYGTMKSFVNEMVNSGRDILLEIEVQGALQVKKMYPDALLLFVTTPTAADLKNRLVGRGTEDIETVNRRLSISVKESELIKKYDYIVINDKVEAACERVHNIIQSAHLTVNNNSELIETMKKDLKQFEG